MKHTSVVLALAAALPGATAAPEVAQDFRISSNVRRSLPNAPDGYTPSSVECPSSRPTVRLAQKISQNESSWLDTRRDKTTSALKDFFGHVTIDNFDAAGYIDRVKGNSSDLPNIGIAVSGGGYRAMLNGAGAIKAFDSRTENSTAAGQLGGLLQSSTYVAGLSGGGWLVGSIYINNFTSISDLQTHKDGAVWQLENSILEGPDTGGIQLFDSVGYWKDIHDEVSSKSDAGFPTSITDYWGRALSYQFVNDTKGGPSQTWSSIALTDDFQQGNMPLPILVADGRNPGELIISSNATVFEINPWEFGSFDPTVFGFVPTQYLGSRFVGGSLPDNETCVRGFDNGGFIMGTSSSLFNQFFLNVNSTALPGWLKDIFTHILGDIGEDSDDIAVYSPNPFYGWRNNSSPYSSYRELDIVDGGEDLQNIPLHPLIQPERHVDVIFAVDSSADTDCSWPNGTALVATYERTLNSTGIANGTAFPAVPDTNTFVNMGLNKRPTFFGCNSTNATSSSGDVAPLVVYLPNAPYVLYSNVSTFHYPSYNDTYRDLLILNGQDVVTQGNSTVDKNWSTCVGCAVLSRSLERTNTDMPQVCTQCFKDYCWDGTINSTTPAAYEPTTKLHEMSANSAASIAMPTMFSLVISAGAALLTLM